MNYQRLKYLYHKNISNDLEDSEFKEFLDAMEFVDQDTLDTLFKDTVEEASHLKFDQGKLFLTINNKINEIEGDHGFKAKNISIVSLKFIYQIAAILALFAMFSYFVFYHSSVDYNDINNSSISSTVDSLRLSSANIEFSDGRSLELDDLSQDTILYNGISILKIDHNVLAIQRASNNFASDVEQFNRFAAKAGSILKLILPDETVVQLNSGSSINISSNFGSKNRKVSLEGEGYFEVTHNKDLPFVVDIKGASINVLGTVFNISAYQQDSQVKATLLQGSISINTKSDHTLIKPGQQAIVNDKTGLTVVNNVDLSRELAWRDGVFRFKDESIGDIMNELSKWYLIKDIHIDDGIKEKFTGSIKRTKQLEDVLTALEEVSYLKIEIEEGRVRVMK